MSFEALELALSAQKQIERLAQTMDALWWRLCSMGQTEHNRLGTLEEAKLAHVARVLSACDDDKTAAAKILGIDRKTLWYMQKRAQQRLEAG